MSDQNKEGHLSHVNEHLQLDWSKVLFAKFGVVRCVSVWVAVQQYGPFKLTMSDGLLSVGRYMQILNDVVLPFLLKNNDMIYVQESNEITKSDVIRSWLQIFPEVTCVTWPTNINEDFSPIANFWDNMIKYVDEHFPLTGYEIKRFIFDFWEIMKDESEKVDYKFTYIQKCCDEIESRSSQSQ